MESFKKEEKLKICKILIDKKSKTLESLQNSEEIKYLPESMKN